MARTPSPNRIEASDIAYSINDGIDGVVLNEATGEGAEYPDLSVSAISRCITEAEKTIDYKAVFANLRKYG